MNNFQSSRKIGLEQSLKPSQNLQQNNLHSVKKIQKYIQSHYLTVVKLVDVEDPLVV